MGNGSDDGGPLSRAASVEPHDECEDNWDEDGEGGAGGAGREGGEDGEDGSRSGKPGKTTERKRRRGSSGGVAALNCMFESMATDRRYIPYIRGYIAVSANIRLHPRIQGCIRGYHISLTTHPSAPECSSAIRHPSPIRLGARA